jgi:hypothetical protein
VAAVAGVEIALVFLRSLGFQVPGLNRNLFAFQLVLAASVILTFARGAALRIAPSCHFS